MERETQRIEDMDRKALEDLARLALQRERRLYGYLTRHLSEGWRGKSLAELVVCRQGPGRLQAVLNEALGWCNGVADRIAADGARMEDLEPVATPAPPPLPSPRCMAGCDRVYCRDMAEVKACARWMPEAAPE